MSLPLYGLQQLINALSIGSLYALMAVGLAMVFGILRLINFAHGDLMMVSAYIAAYALLAKLPLGIALILMVAGTILVGILMERVAYRPIRNAPAVAALLTSFAVGQILQNGTLLITRLDRKPNPLAFPAPDVLRGVIALGDLTISRVTLVSLIARPVLLLLTAFVLGAALASAAGLLYAVQAGQISPYLGFTPVLKAFIAAVIGGFGSIAGAVVGGYALGLLEVLLTALPGLGDILPQATTSPV